LRADCDHIVVGGNDAEPVGDGDDGDLVSDQAQLVHDLFFGFSIKGRTGFIQKHDGRIGVKGAGYGDALTFTAREF
jgi:hypothetical protein